MYVKELTQVHFVKERFILFSQIGKNIEDIDRTI